MHVDDSHAPYLVESADPLAEPLVLPRKRRTTTAVGSVPPPLRPTRDEIAVECDTIAAGHRDDAFAVDSIDAIAGDLDATAVDWPPPTRPPAVDCLDSTALGWPPLLRPPASVRVECLGEQPSNGVPVEVSERDPEVFQWTMKRRTRERAPLGLHSSVRPSPRRFMSVKRP